MKITRTIPTICPACGHRITSASHVATATAPVPGDFTVCLYCSTLLTFADDLSLRNLTDAEMIEAAGDKEVLATMRFVNEFQKWKAKHENKG